MTVFPPGDVVFNITTFKGCVGVVLTHGIWMGKVGCGESGRISKTERYMKFILGSTLV